MSVCPQRESLTLPTVPTVGAYKRFFTDPRKKNHTGRMIYVYPIYVCQYNVLMF